VTLTGNSVPLVVSTYTSTNRHSPAWCWSAYSLSSAASTFAFLFAVMGVSFW